MRKFTHLTRVFCTLLILCITTYAYSQTVINLTVSQPTVLESDAGMDTFVYLGDTVQIGGEPSASGGTPPYFYTWTPATKLSDPTAANPLAYPGATTTYSLKVTDYNSCTSSSKVKVKVSTSGIVENSNFKVNIYPNPNIGRFNVEILGNSGGEMTLEVLNNLGQVLYKEAIERINGNYKASVNISDYPEGVYMLRLSGDNVNILESLIVR